MSEPKAVCRVCGGQFDLDNLNWQDSDEKFVEESAECPDCTSTKFDIER